MTNAAATPARARAARATRFAALAAAALGCSGAAAQNGARLAGLERRLDQLEVRIERTESIRAIKRLQHAYGHYAEFGLWHDLAELFAADAVGHYPAGDLVGKRAIANLFFEQVGQGALGLADGRFYPHLVLQPVVTLDADGRSAHGRWHVLAMLGSYGGSASWVGGIYENDYVLEDGAWKISELRYFTQFSGSYEAGWTNPRVPAAVAPAPATGAGASPPADGGPARAPGVRASPPAAVPKICENYVLNACTIPFHYDVARAGAPTPPASAASELRPGGPEPPDLAALRGRAGELERRAARLGDESAVANLQHAYGYYADRKLWDDVADLFTAEAALELGLQGVYAGRASIRRALEQFGVQGLREGELNDHLQLQTIVTVAPDGNSASARGVDLALWGARTAGEYRAEWREAIFENTYVKENGVWKVAAMHLFPRLATDYSQGWAKHARPAPAPSEEFPPDRPPTVVHGVYPQFYIPPFGFVNPVTGKPPQYPEGTRAAAPANAEPAEARVGGRRAARCPGARGARRADRGRGDGGGGRERIRRRGECGERLQLLPRRVSLGRCGRPVRRERLERAAVRRDLSGARADPRLDEAALSERRPPRGLLRYPPDDPARDPRRARRRERQNPAPRSAAARPDRRRGFVDRGRLRKRSGAGERRVEAQRDGPRLHVGRGLPRGVGRVCARGRHGRARGGGARCVARRRFTAAGSPAPRSRRTRRSRMSSTCRSTTTIP